MNTEATDALRAEFEAWARGHNLNLLRNRLGDYTSPAINTAWAGYKAGATAMAETCAKACDQHAREYDHDGRADRDQLAMSIAAEACAQSCRDAARGKP